MAVADEMAWEARVPWTHPKTARVRRWRPTAQPVPERFTIVIPDLLVSLTFEPHIGRNPRSRHLAHRPTLASTMFDPVVVIAPVVWEPTLPTGTRRTIRELRRSRNQSSLDPTDQGVLAAQLLTWMPSLPTTTSRRPLRPRATGAFYELEFSALAAGVICTAMVEEALTASDLLDEILTSSDLIDEGVC